MVGHSFQNYDMIYVDIFAAYTRNIRYVWAFIPYIWPFISRIYAYICVTTGAHICVINAHIYVSKKGPYIRVLKCAYTRGFEIPSVYVGTKSTLFGKASMYDGNEKTWRPF